jgi:hypothetical protein
MVLVLAVALGDFLARGAPTLVLWTAEPPVRAPN